MRKIILGILVLSLLMLSSLKLIDYTHKKAEEVLMSPEMIDKLVALRGLNKKKENPKQKEITNIGLFYFRF